MVRAGYRIEVHTWDHKSLTGQSTHTKPLSPAQVRAELVQTINAIVAAGAPRPTMWRPPYGDVNGDDINIARSLGLRLVMPWSVDDTIVDNGDWVPGVTTPGIVRNVTQLRPTMGAGAIIAGHDGIDSDAPASIAAMPAIVRWMNLHHLGASGLVPPDATGGIRPPEYSHVQGGNQNPGGG